MGRHVGVCVGAFGRVMSGLAQGQGWAAQDIDLFNIHFGTPSKMNETLSNMACLSLLQDVPQICLQFAVWVADLSGMQAARDPLESFSFGFARHFIPA